MAILYLRFLQLGVMVYIQQIPVNGHCRNELDATMVQIFLITNLTSGERNYISVSKDICHCHCQVIKQCYFYPKVTQMEHKAIMVFFHFQLKQ